MTPEELHFRKVQNLAAALIGLDNNIIADALENVLNADEQVALIVQLKRNLCLPVDLGTEEVPGHGVWNPRAHDPNSWVADLEVKSEH